jgi:hypothetical protein
MSVFNVIGPHRRNRRCRALDPLLLCMMAMGLVVSVGLSQPIPDTILLPDSLGPLRRPCE